MNHRQQIIAFARMNGLSAKADRHGIVILHKAAADQRNDWADCFDNWAQAHAFLLAAVHAVRDGATNRYPWDRA